MKRRSRTHGATLPIVLILTAMMLVTASAWLQTSTVAGRATIATRERAQAFHAADSALIRCSRMLSLALPSTSQSKDEPSRWRAKTSFEGPTAAAITPFPAWPYARRAPQCLIESWGSGSYLVTSRGFGATADSEAWLQLRTDIADGVSTQHWRRVVARPF
ncbi:pilus assembly PilX N-terminal domain-containing protein [Caballeronia sp. INDeC2]|uniref:pilus assembly PilX family protein n=1 Tax=Caballeronia sp. INDeC2 TaxID=2921747 RepID=UPI0020295562|nr:pilus assembly PilX N-terminal domain-containing protein [Caballeronia sp. INDeC2]